MVDFRKHIPKRRTETSDPIEIYAQLDRASDKGPLRPVQERMLRSWYADHRTKKDLILKLHTGQGKTLIGLLALQSRLHETKRPALYLCPNTYLVAQTLEQARQFGVQCVQRSTAGLPPEFTDGKAILVTTVQSVVNGRSVFKMGPASIPVGSVCVDDAHACVDAIRSAFRIRLEAASPAYGEIRALFEDALKGQGAGQWADIELGKESAFLPIPYWAWRDREHDVARVLARHEGDSDDIRFAWPLLRDRLTSCQCVVAGTRLEIAPYRAPVELFGSFSNASHRLFMSATVADDSVLVRDLGVAPDAVRAPLSDPDERWSGEKMVLIPSRISEDLDDASVVPFLGREAPKRKIGVVVLCPSFAHTKRWEGAGALVGVRGEPIDQLLAKLRRGECQKTVVFASRYDGIDLADDACRILVLDGLPFAETLIDRHVCSCREGSVHVRQAVARAIEQGFGRAVRGERDYCAVVLLHPALVEAVAGAEGRTFLSAQTQKQVEIGQAIVDLAREDLHGGAEPKQVFSELLTKLVRRDPGWKEFYAQQMDTLESSPTPPRALDTYVAEREAEIAFERADYPRAVKRLQRLVDDIQPTPSERGWYLQEMARYTLPMSVEESNRLQVAAHRSNRYVLKPREGMTYAPITVSAQRRVARIIAEVRALGSSEALRLRVNELLDALQFGVEADPFERALNDLGKLLGFEAQRPDREFREGPDNLWAVRQGHYLLFECKSEVEDTRAAISRHETGQMDNSCAWFRENYRGVDLSPVMVIPTERLSPGAAFSEPVRIFRKGALNALRKAVRAFYREFERFDFADLDEARVNEWLALHKLGADDLLVGYGEAPAVASRRA